MSAPALDRDRLLRDLRAAAADAALEEPRVTAHIDIALYGMARAWRIVAAAIEDGEYDSEEVDHAE